MLLSWGGGGRRLLSEVALACESGVNCTAYKQGISWNCRLFHLDSVARGDRVCSYADLRLINLRHTIRMHIHHECTKRGAFRA
jgi:hypothetical protein